MNKVAVTYIQLSVVIAPGPLVLSGTFRLPITVIVAIVDGHLNVLVVGHGGGDSGWSKEAAIVKKGSVDRTKLLGNGSLRHGMIKIWQWHGMAGIAGMDCTSALDGRPR